MNNWQEIAVALLLAFSLGYVARKIYLFFRGVKKNDNPCENCVTGCELRDMLEKRRKECQTAEKEKNKKCGK
ncbi:MAG: hypothetical protein ACK5ND_03655 [Bacteroides sp.]